MEHVINLLQSLTFTLWDTEPCKDEAKCCDRPKDKSYFGTQTSVLWVDQVGDGKVDGEAGDQD